MKRILLLILLCVSILVHAQTDVYLNINHLLGTQTFTLNTQASSPSGEAFKVNRLEYYISEITLIHDGGQETMVPDYWILVNASNTESYLLGNFSITTLEGVKFGIGVNVDVNHLDPASYPMSHPLAPKSPSMHWGWSSGYRFLALEGKSGNNFSQTFEIHGLGDGNYAYSSTTLDGEMVNGDLHINLDADYTKLLDNISVASGPISHGETGISRSAIMNLNTIVFAEAAAPNGINNPAVSDLHCFPVPSNGSVFITPDWDEAMVTIEVLNVNGQRIRSFTTGNSGLIEIEDLPKGVYFIQAKSDDVVIGQVKAVVVK